MKRLWTWFKCRALNIHSPTLIQLGRCPCQPKGAPDLYRAVEDGWRSYYRDDGWSA